MMTNEKQNNTREIIRRVKQSCSNRNETSKKAAGKSNWGKIRNDIIPGTMEQFVLPDYIYTCQELKI